MKKLNMRKTALVLLVILFGFTVQAYSSPAEVSGEITTPCIGNVLFVGDTTLSYHTIESSGDSPRFYPGIGVSSGQSATSNGNYNINIIFDGARKLDTSLGYRTFGYYAGIYATGGGTVDLENNKVVIEGLRYGINADSGGTVILGDGSKIYAEEFVVGEAIIAYNENTRIVVGEDADIKGVVFGEGGTIYASDKATIEIGDRATIINDASESSLTYNGSTSNYYYSHVAVYAKNGSNIEIGANSDISTSAGDNNDRDDARYNDVVFAYGTTSDLTTISIGAGSYIHSLCRQSKGIYSIANAKITVGEGSHIEMGGDSSTGVYIHTGGEVVLGKNVKIDVSGQKASALFIFYQNNAQLTAGEMDFDFEEIKATSAKSNVITGATGNKLNFNFKNSTLKGDVLATGYNNVYAGNYQYETSEINLVLLGNSSWEGSMATESYENSGYDATMGRLKYLNIINDVNLSLKETSKWIVSKNSFLTNLNMESFSTAVEFSHNFAANDDPFYTAEVESIDGMGTLIMNVDMNMGKGDFLYAKEASGAYNLLIKHNNVGGVEKLQLLGFDEYTSADENSVKLVDDDDLSVSSIRIGAYDYTLKAEESFTQWWLLRGNLDGKIKEDSGVYVVGMDEFVKAVDATISDEILKAKNHIWVTSFYGLQKFDKDVLNVELKQQIGGGLLGIDSNITDKLNLGAFFGLNLAYQNIDQDSVGNISSLTAGAYANYSNRNFTASGYLRAANYKNDLILSGSSNNTVKTTIDTYGFGGSVQLSYQISLFERFYLEPKGKATYTYLAGGTYDVGGMKLEMPTSAGLMTWLGAKVGMKSKDDKVSPYNYYLEVGWIHDTNSDVTYFTTENRDENVVSLGKNRVEIGIGFSADILKQSNISLELKYSQGKGIVQPIKIVLGGSCYF